VLALLHANTCIEDTLDLAKDLAITHIDLDKVLKSLLVDDYVVLTVIERKLVELSDEGKGYVAKGTPEF
jgi:phenylalanyl-tRNA synthetase alpha chain